MGCQMVTEKRRQWKIAWNGEYISLFTSSNAVVRTTIFNVFQTEDDKIVKRDKILHLQHEIAEEWKGYIKEVQLQYQKMNPVRPRRVILILSKDSSIEKLQILKEKEKLHQEDEDIISEDEPGKTTESDCDIIKTEFRIEICHYQVFQDNLTNSVQEITVEKVHWMQYAAVRYICNFDRNSEEKWRQLTSVVDVCGSFLVLVFLVLVFLVLVFIVLLHKDFMKAGYKNADTTIILIVQMVKKAKVSKLKSSEACIKESVLLRLNS